MNTGTQNFLKEAAIMQDVDHDHIVRMYGVVLDTDDSLMMVSLSIICSILSFVIIVIDQWRIIV